MKIRLTILALLVGFQAAAQKEAAFACGEKLEYMVSYRAKLVPNSDVATVTVNTTCPKLDGRETYRVEGKGRVQPFFRWFFDLNDTYNTWLDVNTLRPLKFTADLREGSYRFTNTILYDWSTMTANSKYRNLKRPNTDERNLPLTYESCDAIAQFFNLRATNTDGFVPGQAMIMQVVLEDTIRKVQYKFLAREERDVKGFGRFKTLKFSCQLATSTGESFEDGSEFFVWISDDLNKIPLYIESPIRVGSIRARITKFENLKYPLDSKIK